MVGKTLSHYEILEPLGAGGMGEVYLGRDSRLGRKVAIKVLPAQFASIPERRARFEQEARAAAALNHPHIAVLHDIGSDGETHFMVQEYLEGKNLRERLEKGALPLRKALDYAIEIGEALAAAHKAGIVHRDLKPDNVFVTEEGHAKVLDFGLAKLTEAAPAAGSELTVSPTVLGTVPGQVMGTAGYMAPEQVNGEEVDPRADLFAFGCVLYEMTSGQRAFGGRSVLDALHAIVHSEPRPLGEIKQELPAELQRILRKCLAKDPAARYQTAADLVVDLRVLAGDVDAGNAASIADVAPAAWRQRESGLASGSRARLALFVIVPAVAAVAAVGAWEWLGSSPAIDYPIRLTITNPTFSDSEGNGVWVSPDGKEILFAALPEDGSERALHVRSAASTAVRKLSEITSWAYPFFSPDGEWLAFREENALVKAALSGGSPLLIHELPDLTPNSFQGGAWSEDGWILISSGGDLYRVPEDGSAPPALVAAADPELGALRHPDLLPGGAAALVTLWRDSVNDTRIGIADLATGRVRDLQIDGSDPQWLPTGHLVWVRDDSIFAAPFDAERGEITGSRQRVQDGIEVGPAGPGKLSISPAGTLAYSAAGISADSSLVWVDRSGNREAIRTGIDEVVWTPRLSPDGRRIAMALGGQSLFNARPWVYDLDAKTLTALTSPTSDSSLANFPVWTPDGASLVYTSMADGTIAIYRKSADFTGEAQLVVLPGAVPFSFTPDSRQLAFVMGELGTSMDIAVTDLAGGEPRVLLGEDFNETAPMISPDGRWLAYVSNATGANEVYVRPFPGPGAATQVSNDGGMEPHWSPDGAELFYRTGPYGSAMMAVEVMASGAFGFRNRRQLFVNDRAIYHPSLVYYDVAGDGQRFLMAERGSGEEARGGIVVVFNWFEELTARVPIGR